MKKATRTRKYMFICAYGKNRSPTAARVAKELAEKANIRLEASHLEGGLYNEELDDLDRAGRKSFSYRLNIYDRLFVMEDYMAEKLVIKYKINPKKVVCLNIEDAYCVNSPDLVGILEKKLKEWIK